MNNVVPGTPIQISGSVELGDGLFTYNGQIFSSRVGALTSTSTSTTPLSNSQPTASIVSSLPAVGHALVPSISQVIIGTVTRITGKYVGVDINVLEGGSKAIYLEEPFKGTLRSQDIWPQDEKDAPQQLFMAFRPGDLIRAKIIGIGDASAGFLLSTGLEDSLGVIFAKSTASGEPLVPISWNEMICPQTGIKEPRKPSKPKQSNL